MAFTVTISLSQILCQPCQSSPVALLSLRGKTRVLPRASKALSGPHTLYPRPQLFFLCWPWSSHRGPVLFWKSTSLFYSPLLTSFRVTLLSIALFKIADSSLPGIPGRPSCFILHLLMDSIINIFILFIIWLPQENGGFFPFSVTDRHTWHLVDPP